MRLVAPILFITTQQLLLGCSCLMWGPPCQEAWQYESVVLARVLDIDEPEEAGRNPRDPNWTPRRVKLYVKENLLGRQAAKTTMDVWTGRGGGDCGYPFQRGETYVIYAHRASTDKLTAGTCSRTRTESEAVDDLAYFRGLQQRPSSGEVFGSVLPGARVVVSGPSGKKEVIAGTDGKYRVAGLPPGNYEIHAAAEGYSQTMQMRPIELRAKGCREQDLFLGIDRRVRGRVKSADATPLSGIELQLVPVRPRREGDAMNAAYTATTATDGSYEFKTVDEGDYYLGINVLYGPAPTSQFPRWLYPGTTEAKAAVPLRVPATPGVQTLDFTLPEAQDPRSISGQVVFSDGRPAAGVMVMCPAVYSPFDGVGVTETDKDGRFHIELPQRTAFRLRFWISNSPDSNGVWAEASIPASGEVPPLRMMLQPGRPPDHTSAIREAWEKGSGLP